MGLISAEHQMGQDTEAIATVEKMPPASYESTLNNTDFLSMLGAIYQQNNRYDVAQQLLERAAKLQSAGGAQPSLQLQMQLASIYLQRNNTAQAYGIYRQVLTAHPDNQEAWKGLIAALQSTDHTAEALQQIAYIPPAVRKQMEMDPEFVQAEASLYASSGGYGSGYCVYESRGGATMQRLASRCRPAWRFQNAWLLFNTRNDRGLYPALMNLGGRNDLTVPQREQVQNLWASWATQRASAAFDNGNNERAVQILEAASAAFPENLTVKRVLAGGYLKVGMRIGRWRFINRCLRRTPARRTTRERLARRLRPTTRRRLRLGFARRWRAIPAITEFWERRRGLSRRAAIISARRITGGRRLRPCRRARLRTGLRMSLRILTKIPSRTRLLRPRTWRGC